MTNYLPPFMQLANVFCTLYAACVCGASVTSKALSWEFASDPWVAKHNAPEAVDGILVGSCRLALSNTKGLHAHKYRTSALRG